MEPKQQKPSIGRVVHFVLDKGRSKGQHRPALIVRVWGEDPANPAPYVNLQVFTDADNDELPAVLWVTSAQPDHEEKSPRTWHWPEYVG